MVNAAGNILKNISFLIVDDFEDLTESMENFLSEYSDNILVAYNGEEGYELFKKKSPDIIITDINMPKMDGLEMAKNIKTINHDIPIIVMTGYNEADLMMKGLQLGLDKFLLKPVDLQILLNILIQNANNILLKKESNDDNHSLFQSLDINPKNLIYIKDGKISYLNQAIRNLFKLKNTYEYGDAIKVSPCTRELETLPCFHELGDIINDLENKFQTEQYFCFCNINENKKVSKMYSGTVIPLTNKNQYLINVNSLA